jgi:hypothetical protein
MGLALTRRQESKKAGEVVITMFYVLIGVIYGVLGALVARTEAMRKA